MRNIFSVLGNAFASFRDMITESERLPKNEIDAYRVRIRNHRRAVYIRAALIVVVLLAAAVIAYRVYERRSYDSYEIISDDSSPLLSRFEARQKTRYDALTEPEMQYRIVQVKYPCCMTGF